MIKLSAIAKRLMQEATIGSIETEIQLDVIIDKTVHAAERGEQRLVTDNEIIDSLEDAADKIIRALIFDKVDINQKVNIYQKSTGLMIAGVIESKAPYAIQLKVTTVYSNPNKTDQELKNIAKKYDSLLIYI